jgi:hypothetical protein
MRRTMRLQWLMVSPKTPCLLHSVVLRGAPLTSARSRTLRSAGVDRAALELLAGDDRIIAGAPELEALGTFIDSCAPTDRAAVTRMMREAQPVGIELASGALLDVLSRAACPSDQSTLRDFSARFGKGFFDLSRLTPEAEQELSACRSSASGRWRTSQAVQALGARRPSGAPGCRSRSTRRQSTARPASRKRAPVAPRWRWSAGW